MTTHVNYNEARNLGRRWGLANGYKGEAGGWIYKVTGSRVRTVRHRSRYTDEVWCEKVRVPVCQGWAEFYRRFRKQITAQEPTP